MTKKTWPILAGAALVTLVAVLVIRSLRSSVVVEAATAEIAPIREFVDEQAQTRLPQTYLVTMPYTARIEPIALAEGTLVRRGDPVAQIVPADIELAVTEATAGLGEAEASITEGADTKLEEVALRQVRAYSAAMKSATEASRKQQESAQAGLDYAVRDFARIDRLFRTGAETEDNLELARLRRVEREVAHQQAVLTHAAMQSFQVATDLLEETIRQYLARKQLNVAVLRQRKAQVDARLRRALLDQQRGTMTSPVDGVVLSRAVSNACLLPAGATLLEIGRLEDLEVEAEVLSQDVVRVKEGQRVEIYGPAIGRRRADGKDHAHGTINKIYPAGFTKISSLGVEQQRVKVIVAISDEDLTWLRREQNLGVGYRVRVRVSTAEKPDALVIPRSALFRAADGGWQVYAIRNHRVSLQDVQVGLMNDEAAEIASGLSEGEQVVLAPESNLEHGARVTVKTAVGETD
jgi:HlyD family secretion protein